MRRHPAADNDEDMIRRLAELSTEQQEHFKTVVRLLSTCYEKDSASSGVLIIRNNSNVALISLNANEMDTTEMVLRASEVLQDTVCEDAPPRDRFN